MISEELKTKIYEHLNKPVVTGYEEPWNKYNDLVIHMALELIKIESEYDCICNTCGFTDCVKLDLVYIIQVLKNDVKQ